MKVLMLTRALPCHGPGGMAAAAADLVGALADAGAELRVATTGGGESAHPGVRVHALAAPAGRYSADWWRLSRRLLAELGPWRPDVVLGVSSAANALAAARTPGGPAFVFQAHGTAYGEVLSKLRSGRPTRIAACARNLYWGLARDHAYRRYDAVTAVGRAVERDLQAQPTAALVGATPVRLIRNGIDPTAFAFDPRHRAALRARLSVPAETVVALHAGRIQADKGWEVAVEAVRLARRAGAAAMLLALGDGPDAARLDRSLQAAGAGVRLPGVPRAEMAGWLSAADALLFPTRRREGLPLVVLEALAAGLPVLTTPEGAPDPEPPCLRFDPNDAGAFADALAALAPGQDRSSRLPDVFRLERAAQDYLALFHALATPTREPLAA